MPSRFNLRARLERRVLAVRKRASDAAARVAWELSLQDVTVCPICNGRNVLNQQYVHNQTGVVDLEHCFDHEAYCQDCNDLVPKWCPEYNTREEVLAYAKKWYPDLYLVAANTNPQEG